MADAFLATVGQFWGRVGTVGDTFNLDLSTDAFAIVCQIPEAITITVIGLGTAVGAGTSPVYKWSIQGVGTDGLPDGTVKGGGSPASVSEAGLVVRAFDVHTLDNSYAASKGEILALVVEYVSGTIDGSNFVKIQAGMDFRGAPFTTSFPLWLTDTAGAGFVQSNLNFPIFGVRSVSKTLGMPIKDGPLAAQSTYDSRDTLESGLRFKLDGGWGDTFELAGGMYHGEIENVAAKNIHMSLYSGITTPVLLETISIDADLIASTSQVGALELFFDDAVTLNFNTEYFLMFSSDHTVGRAPVIITFETAGDLAAVPWGGEFYSAIRTETEPPSGGGTGFTTDATVRPLIALILADWTEPAGGGGGGIRIAGPGGLAG